MGGAVGAMLTEKILAGSDHEKFYLLVVEILLIFIVASFNFSKHFV